MAKIEFSCKRKKDFVTVLAIAMFSVICIFEFYLIIILPIQLKRQDFLAFEVKKQEMLNQTMILQWKFRHTKPKTRLQECEMRLISDSYEQISRFLRKHSENLTHEQLNEADELLRHLNSLSAPWLKGQYNFKEKEFDITPILKSIEKKFDDAPSAGI